MAGFFESLPRPASEVGTTNFTGRIGEPGAAYLLARNNVMPLSDAQVRSYKEMPTLQAGLELSQTTPATTAAATQRTSGVQVAGFNNPFHDKPRGPLG